jgi:hypothetical protein
MIKPVASLKLTKKDECINHDIVIEALGNKLYSRIKPQFTDKRLDTIIGQITGDAYLEFSITRLDSECLEQAKQYIYKRLVSACETEELLKSYDAKVALLGD